MPESARTDRLERLINLVLVLLDTRRPLTLRELSASVVGYPDGGEAARQAFERDKRALRDLGIPLTVEPVDGEEQVGYRIRPEEYFLADLGLTGEERQALAFAVAAVQLGGAAGWNALAKLGGPVSEAAIDRAGLAPGEGPGAGPHVAPVAVLPSLPQLGEIHEAMRRRSVLHFEYRGRRREVEPYLLAFRNAAWYLVGRELGAPGGPATKTFRVDRMAQRPELGPPRGFDPPEGTDLDAIKLLPWSSEPSAGDDGCPAAEVVVDARLARVVAAQVAREAVVGFDGEGAVRIRLGVGDEAAFVSFVAGLGDTAVVESPPELRDAVVARLEQMLEAPAAAAPARAARRRRQPATSVSKTRLSGTGHDGAGAVRRRGGSVVAGERLRRLLAILVHLARVGEASLAELAGRFSMTEEELVTELELAACCGVPPYTPDQLIELYVDGDRVIAEGLRQLARPQRLTPDEGFVLAAATRALLEVPGAAGEGPMRSALAKLEAALGSSPLALEIEVPTHLGPLQAAAEASERVEIEYFKSSAAAPTPRLVDPYQVVLREGRWYLDGWCHKAEGFRRFQVDRVLSVRRTGEQVGRSPERLAELAALSSRPGAFLGGPDSLRARLAFPAESAFVVEPVAVGPLEELGDGRVAATLDVGDVEGWFGRLLLRLGPGVTVLSPVELADAGAVAARRALRRYGR
ncbi:MAG: WYL domain-containing protein [Actinomycetota bacterium]|nr:WYL domain-containing protein [Actinomycetota bacterium]